MRPKNPDGSGRFWYRLGPESRAEVAAAYRAGATARALAAKWKVAPTTIYRWACEDGFTKKANSDALARAHAAEVETSERAAEEAASAAVQAEEEAAMVELGPAAEGGDPDALGRAALAGSAAALKRGRTRDALELARLAEGYFRLADRGRKLGDAPDLDLILRAITEREVRTALFRIDPDDPHPHPAKLKYWGGRA